MNPLSDPVAAGSHAAVCDASPRFLAFPERTQYTAPQHPRIAQFVLRSRRRRATSSAMSESTPDPTAPTAEPAKPTPPAPLPKEIGGPAGPEPTRYGDWEHKGRCSDF
jgi:hypothetical protein